MGSVDRLQDRYADPVLTCAASRDWEHDLLGDDPVASWLAMQAAGKGVAEAVAEDLAEQSLPPVGRALILAGKGHNGGDALIALRVLLDRWPDLRALVVLATGTQSLRPLTRKALEAIDPDRNARIELAVWRGGSGDRLGDCLAGDPFDFCLDGLLGMSFKPPLRGGIADIIACVNRNPSIRLRAAVDLPSGMGDTSDPDSFRADITYVAGTVKSPVVALENLPRVGRFRYVDIGFFARRKPPADTWVLKDAILDPLRALRSPATDKRTYGHVFVLTGSRPYPGALLMSVRSALQSGAGLVTAFAPESLAATLAAHAPEAIWVPWPETLAGSLALEGRHLLASRSGRCTSLVVGPGLGNEAETLDLLVEADRLLDVPMVIDADGLQGELINEVMARPNRAHPPVLTPHHGEFERIAGRAPSDRALTDYSRENRVITVLKGPVTRISDGQVVYLSPFGGPVLARGGSGDLLAGIMGATLAGGPDSILEAACRAVVWHGCAADCLARSRGQVAVRTTELLAELPTALRTPRHGR